MAVILKFQVEGSNFSNAGHASSTVKKALKQLNIEPKTIKRIVVSLYEAEVNIIAHAYKGEIEVEIFEDKIEIIVVDKGPGIEDINQAMKAGFSTASEKVREMGFGAGMGLPNIKKNTDQLEITSEYGKWVKVKMINRF